MRAFCCPQVGRFVSHRGNILLPEEYLPGVDNGHPSLCCWVPWNSQGWKAQFLDCLHNVCPTFVLFLDVVGNGIDRFLVLGRIFAFPMSKMWLLSPSTFVTNSFLVGPVALVGLRNFLAPSILGLASDMFLLSSFSGLHNWGCSVKVSLHG
jgi:hypothetical protein